MLRVIEGSVEARRAVRNPGRPMRCGWRETLKMLMGQVEQSRMRAIGREAQLAGKGELRALCSGKGIAAAMSTMQQCVRMNTPSDTNAAKEVGVILGSAPCAVNPTHAP
jgi:hypothetical protein